MSEPEIPEEAVEVSAVPKYRLDAAKFVLQERERELLALKGPCSFEDCRLHYAHSGPCDTTRNQS